MSEENQKPAAKRTAKRTAKRATKRPRKSATPEAPSAAAAPHPPEPPSNPGQGETPPIHPGEPTPTHSRRGGDSDDSNENANKHPKRRRGKKGKGGSDGPHQREDTPDGAPDSTVPPPHTANEPEASKPRGRDASRNPPQSSPPPRQDGDALARKAWKIFLAEVSEEGLALISDGDARDVARRSFRLAEIFLDEQARHE